jgi:hypothetical protein
MSVMSILWENAAVFAVLAVCGAVLAVLNFFVSERSLRPPRPTQRRTGAASAKQGNSLLLAANDLLLLLGVDHNCVQLSSPFLELIIDALKKNTTVYLLVRVKDDSEQQAVTCAVQHSLLPSSGFDMRRLLFCETNECQVPVARQLLPTVFASAHGPSVAEVHRLESKRGFVRSCIAVPSQSHSSLAIEHIAAALDLPNRREKSE